MLIRRKTRRPVAAASLVAFGVALGVCVEAAQAQWYTVEIIAFEHVVSQGGGSESWPSNPGAPALSGTVALKMLPAYESAAPECDPALVNCPPAADRTSPSPAPETRLSYRVLDPSRHRLTGVRRALSRLSQYRPLLHMAWRQPAVSRQRAATIHLRDDLPSPYSFSSGTRDPDGFASAAYVSGTLRLYRARYLHLIADLVYYRPPPGGSGQWMRPAGTTEAGASDPSAESYHAEWTVPTRFRMQEHRRMRSKELHYLDHPLFGLLVEITPYEPTSASGTAEGEPLEEAGDAAR